MFAKKILFVSVSLYSVLTFAQDSLSLARIDNTINYFQFNTFKTAANAGIQGKTFSLSTFSTLPNNSFIKLNNAIGINGYINKKEKLALGIHYTLENSNNILLKNSLGVVFKGKINDFHIGLGIERSQLKLNDKGLTFGDMIDPRKGFVYPTSEPNIKDTSITLNIKPSVIYSKNKIKIGLSINHAAQENQSLLGNTYNLPMEINLSASYQIPLKEKWRIIPLLDYTNSAIEQHLIIGSYLCYHNNRKTHFLGWNYENQKSVNFSYGINFNTRLKFSGQVIIPIYYRAYFPVSGEVTLQYKFKKE